MELTRSTSTLHCIGTKGSTSHQGRGDRSRNRFRNWEEQNYGSDRTTQRKDGEEEKESLDLKDPFTDMAFLHTLALHGFKGSEIWGVLLRCRPDARGRR